tara:strand:+ start:15431 stop:16225 length:795 start_codon:yes stop_codon:yes gene_type:complete
MSRISDTFKNLRESKRTGLVTFVTAGDPNSEKCKEILISLDRSGADVIEIGVPFSDPLADGPVIQRSSERGLSSGMNLSKCLELIDGVRSSIRAPIVVFSYANPVVSMGFKVFAQRAAEVGVDGVLVLDLPIEEADEFREIIVDESLDPIFLLSPTTTEDRIKKAAKLGSGFLYCISRLGVTGEREVVDDGAETVVSRIRRNTDLPIALGFGISKPEHVVAVGRWADAAVVGSGLVNKIASVSSPADVGEEVEEYVRWLKGKGD